MRDGDDQPFGLELPQRLAHRGAADADLLAQLALDEALARPEMPGSNRFPDAVLHQKAQCGRLPRDAKIHLGHGLNTLPAAIAAVNLRA